MTRYKVCNKFTSIFRASEQLSKLQGERKQLSKQLYKKKKLNFKVMFTTIAKAVDATCFKLCAEKNDIFSMV